MEYLKYVTQDRDKMKIMINLAWFFFTKNTSTTSTTSRKIRTQRETKELFYSVIGNNITFDWKVALMRIIISYNKLKENTEKIDGKI